MKVYQTTAESVQGEEYQSYSYSTLASSSTASAGTDIQTATYTGDISETSTATETDTASFTTTLTETAETISTNSLFTNESQEYPSSSTSYTTSTTYSDRSYETIYGPTDFTVYYSDLSTTEYESSSALSASSGITKTIGSNVTVSWSTSTQSSSYFSTSWLTMVYSIVPPFPYYVTSSSSSSQATYFGSESSSSTYTTTSDDWTYTTTALITITIDTTVNTTNTLTQTDTTTASATATEVAKEYSSDESAGITQTLFILSSKSNFDLTYHYLYGATRTYFFSYSSSASYSHIFTQLSETVTGSASGSQIFQSTQIESLLESTKSDFNGSSTYHTYQTWVTSSSFLTFTDRKGATNWQTVFPPETDSGSNSLYSTYRTTTDVSSGSTSITHSFSFSLSSKSSTANYTSSVSTTLTSTRTVITGITSTTSVGGSLKTYATITGTTASFSKTTSSTETTTIGTWTAGDVSTFTGATVSMISAPIFETEPGERMFSVTATPSDTWAPLESALLETGTCSFVPSFVGGASSTYSSTTETVIGSMSRSSTTSTGFASSGMEIYSVFAGSANYTVSRPNTNTGPYFGAYNSSATTVSFARGLFDITSQTLTTNTSVSTVSTLESSVASTLETLLILNANFRIHTRSTISFSSSRTTTTNYPLSIRLMGVFTWNTTSLAT